MQRPGASINLMAVILLAAAHLTQAQGVPEIAPAGSVAGAILRTPLEASLKSSVTEAIKRRDYTRAEELVLAEIERDPSSPHLLTLVGSIFFLDGKYLNTLIAMKRAERLAPLDNASRFTLALACITLNHRDWARPEFEKLVQSDPLNPLYPYWLARLDYDAMRFKSAVARLKKAIELDPRFLKAYDNLGLCYEALGQFDQAIESYKEAVRLNGQQFAPSPWPPVNVGTLLVRLGRLEEAEGYLKESLAYEPRFPQAHYQLGLLLEKQGRPTEAIAELEQAAALKPTYAEPHYALGRLYKRAGDTKKAAAAWKNFQRLKKEFPEVRPL